MIVLDTHIWVWWVSGARPLSPRHAQIIDSSVVSGIGVSVISCWEVAVLVARHRLDLDRPPLEWIEKALHYPGVIRLELTPRIAVSSTELPEPFHRDPADRILVATANDFSCPLVTVDERILRYPHVQSYGPKGDSPA